MGVQSLQKCGAVLMRGPPRHGLRDCPAIPCRPKNSNLSRELKGSCFRLRFCLPRFARPTRSYQSAARSRRLGRKRMLAAAQAAEALGISKGAAQVRLWRAALAGKLETKILDGVKTLAASGRHETT
jgi:hypothetical protein